MGQNRKVRQSRDKNKLKTVQLDSIETSVASPLEKVERQSPMFPNYEFRAEVEKDTNNEKRLFWAELIILLSIFGLVVLRGYLLSKF